MKENIIAVIPAYNEEKTIGEVVKKVKKLVNEVIVVDDASIDQTRFIAEMLSDIVISHNTNLGYDKSIDDGFKEANKRKGTIILTFDADGQHLSNDIIKIIKPIQLGEADVVIGIRPNKSRISEIIFSWYSKMKIGIHDPLCGIKAYSSKAYNSIGYFDRLNSVGTELMFNCYKKGFILKEVKININKRKDYPKFGNIFKSNLKILVALIKISTNF